jgi:hypothetical protein
MKANLKMEAEGCFHTRLHGVTSQKKLSSYMLLLFFIMAPQPIVRQGLLIVDVPRSHSDTSHSDTSHSVGLLWTNDEPVEDTST